MSSIKECSVCHEPLLFEVDDPKFKCEVCREYELTQAIKQGIVVAVAAETTASAVLSWRGEIKIKPEYMCDIMSNGKIDKNKLDQYIKDYLQDVEDEFEIEDILDMDKPDMNIGGWKAMEPKKSVKIEPVEL